MVREFSGFRKAAERKLTMLDNASDLKDLLSPPGNRLEMLKADRICFLWKADGPYEVEITDYH